MRFGKEVIFNEDSLKRNQQIKMETYFT